MRGTDYNPTTHTVMNYRLPSSRPKITEPTYIYIRHTDYHFSTDYVVTDCGILKQPMPETITATTKQVDYLYVRN